MRCVSLPELTFPSHHSTIPPSPTFFCVACAGSFVALPVDNPQAVTFTMNELSCSNVGRRHPCRGSGVVRFTLTVQPHTSLEMAGLMDNLTFILRRAIGGLQALAAYGRVLCTDLSTRWVVHNEQIF